ncbi:rhodanese-like domain-containing protein [Gaetbulibacter aestuarii]|uniref:Rhodanese-like domain-containing protein n=1 Tax=Gaetbulibacter aestuarii TaxID=1502358 RepID=A0ABW7MWB8_9FLAO
MKKGVIFLFLVGTLTCFSQNSLVNVLKKYNKNEVSYIMPDQLNPDNPKLILLDARENKEYQVSHIKNAKEVGYKHFDLKRTEALIPNKTSNIVVYCTIGVRSENIATKLKKAGYSNVFNLYGGIIEWKNKKHLVYNKQNKLTDSIHTFSKPWGKWLTNGISVYD